MQITTFMKYVQHTTTIWNNQTEKLDLLLQTGIK